MGRAAAALRGHRRPRARTAASTLRDLRAIAPTLSQVVDVAWRDSGKLLVLAGDAGEDRIVPYLVGVDGWGLADVPTSGLPSQPTSIAAAPTRRRSWTPGGRSGSSPAAPG